MDYMISEIDIELSKQIEFNIKHSLKIKHKSKIFCSFRMTYVTHSSQLTLKDKNGHDGQYL